MMSACVFLATVVIGGVHADLPTSTPPEVPGETLNRIELTGIAKGGCLKLVCEPATGKYMICPVDTLTGQSGDEVAETLQAALESTPHVQYPVRKGNRIYLPWGWAYYLAGSETGFASVNAPRFVTFNVSDDNQARVNWLPQDAPGIEVLSYGAFSAIVAPLAAGESVAAWTSYDNGRSRATFVNERTLEVYSKPEDKHYLRQLVLDLHSRPTRIYISGRRQEDLDNLPFYGNVMPNWVAWSPAGFEEGDLHLYQGEKAEVLEPDRYLICAASPDTKFTCQMFEIPKDTATGAASTEAAGVEAGVYRRYLGLIPGHKYRVLARFNTFESNPAAGDWRLSFHACADPPGQGLTVGQLSGKEPLPSGATLPDGACTASFGAKAQTTDGKWTQVSTGAPGACADIEIPEGSSSLSAWVRVIGTTPTRFGMDWSALEDVTPPAAH